MSYLEDLRAGVQSASSKASDTFASAQSALDDAAKAGNVAAEQKKKERTGMVALWIAAGAVALGAGWYYFRKR